MDECKDVILKMRFAEESDLFGEVGLHSNDLVDGVVAYRFFAKGKPHMCFNTYGV